MSSLSTDLVQILGGNATSPDVERIVREYSLTDVQNDPPFRRYVGSTKIGLSLLFDNDRLIDVQFFVKQTKRYRAYSLPLPFELENGMTSKSVQALLGEPAESDDSHSKYLMQGAGVKLTIEYDKSGEVRYVSVAALDNSIKH